MPIAPSDIRQENHTLDRICLSSRHHSSHSASPLAVGLDIPRPVPLAAQLDVQRLVPLAAGRAAELDIQRMFSFVAELDIPRPVDMVHSWKAG